MKRGIVIRVLGGLFIAVASLNLLSLTLAELRDSVASITAVSIRYLFMLIAGFGLIFLKKWGVYVTIIMVVTNWIMFYVVYDGNSGLYPLWVSFVGPAVFAATFYWSWKALR